MPYEVLDGCHLGEDVTRQLAAFQRVLVHVGQCHGVGVGVALTSLGVVVAEDVVDGDIGKCCQRISDDTLSTVGFLQVIVSGGEGGRHTELQPRLQLGVQIGTYRVAGELRTDDGSLLVHVVTRNEVQDLVVTALGAQLMRVLECSLEHSVLPVCTLTEDRRVRVVGVGLTGNYPSVVYKVFIIFGILAQVHHVEALHLTVNRKRAVVAELSFASLTALGGDEHHTVGALGTINGGSRGIFQNLHRHDIAGVEC